MSRNRALLIASAVVLVALACSALSRVGTEICAGAYSLRIDADGGAVRLWAVTDERPARAAGISFLHQPRSLFDQWDEPTWQQFQPMPGRPFDSSRVRASPPDLHWWASGLGAFANLHARLPERQTDPPVPARRSFALYLPARLTVAVALLPPIIAIALCVRRKREWRSANVCHRCGYDLRATPHRCPECGTPVIPFAA